MNKTFGLRALRRTCTTRLSSILAFIFAVAYLASVTARAGVTVSLYPYNNGNGGSPYYLLFVNLSTNALTPMPANTLFYVWSPSGSTNSGVHAEMDSTGYDADGNGGISYGTYQSLINDVTNEWTLMTIQGTTTNFYSFSFSGFTSNDLPVVTILYPANNAGGVSFSPDFSWSLGPTNYTQLYVQVNSPDYSDDFNANLPLNQTNWQTPGELREETNDNFYVSYNNFSSGVTSSVPVSAASAVFPGWASTSELTTYNDSQFIPTASGTGNTIGHTLIAHYAFDNGSLGQDSSGNGNDLNCWSTWGDNISQTFNTNAEAGAGAAEFYGESGMTPCDASQSLTSWSNTLVGSYSISLWINTTNVVGNDGDAMNDYNGQSVFFADNNGEGSIPVGITGHKIAFFTGDPDNNQDTLHSLNNVTTGGYVHVVVTRNQITGEKRIYVNGTLDSADFGSTELLTGDTYSSIGGAFASAYVGLVDDVQIYSGVLEPAEVTNLFDNPGTAAPNVSPGSDILVAHYSFDNAANLGQDSSGNGYNLTYNGGDGVSASTQAKTGGGAADFDGNSFFSYNTAPAAILSTLAGDFTLSFWINTTENDGNEGGEAYAGAGIVAADVPGQANDLVPAALDGGEIGFNTGPNDDTLNTFVDINDGNYHHVVITRSQATGQKQIYIDGVLNNSDTDTTSLLNAPQLVAIGCQIDASQSNPANANPNNYFQGLLDDMQLYSVVLTSNQVAQLYANPGTVITPTGAPDFNGALDTTNLAWSTTGDTSWFVESTNTYNGAPDAAQSGSVTNQQSSTLSVTVTGPGTLTFDWSSIANDPNQGFDCEFAVDNNDDDDLYGDTSWYQDRSFTIPTGQHTLTWTAYAGGDTDLTEAAFLDNVSYIPANLPVIAVNPFSQTNYPGYQVWLSAVATNTPAITWQWYEVGSGAIAGATTNYFIPTNSGTAGVEGSYYAIATDPAGSTITTTAAVTFVTAPRPPDWSVAFKSPFNSPDTQVSDYYLACLPDSSGNIYAVGEFQGTNAVQFTNDIATNYDSPNGTYSADIIKQTDTGSLLWAVAITNNGSGHSEAYGIAPAPGGGIYVAGNFNGTDWLGTNQIVDLSQGPYNYTNSVFLARFDANGNTLWVRTISGTNYGLTEFNELVADPAGNVTLSGLFWGSTLFPSTNTATSTNLFATGQQGGLAQYDANGALRWAEITTNWLNTMAYSGGRIYGTIGNNNTSFNFGGISVVTSQAKSVVALNAANGQAIWVQGVGEPYGQPNPLNANDGPVVAAVGTNVFVVGTSVGSNAAFGSYTVSWPGLANQYFARCDTNGTPQALATFGSSTTFPRSIVANASGVYVSGDFDSYSVFGIDLIAAPIADRVNDFSQAFLAKFDLNGNPLWANEAVSSGEVNFVGSAVASDGVWVSGVCDSGYYPQPEFTAFGTNHVYSDELLYSPISGGGTIAFWSPAGVLAKVTDSAAMGSPVTLSDELARGANFQFSFTSQADFTHNVLYTTNLVSGNWETYSNVIGDGTMKTITIPLSVFNGSRQGFVRVTTQ